MCVCVCVCVCELVPRVGRAAAVQTVHTARPKRTVAVQTDSTQSQAPKDSCSSDRQYRATPQRTAAVQTDSTHSQAPKDSYSSDSTEPGPKD